MFCSTGRITLFTVSAQAQLRRNVALEDGQLLL